MTSNNTPLATTLREESMKHLITENTSAIRTLCMEQAKKGAFSALWTAPKDITDEQLSYVKNHLTAVEGMKKIEDVSLCGGCDGDWGCDCSASNMRKGLKLYW